MKKLGKLHINMGKIISHDELKKLHGGTWSGRCEIFGGDCAYRNGIAYGETCQEAEDECTALHSLNGEIDCRCECSC